MTKKYNFLITGNFCKQFSIEKKVSLRCHSITYTNWNTVPPISGCLLIHIIALASHSQACYSPGPIPNGQIKTDAPRFPPPQPQTLPKTSPERVRPAMPAPPISNVSALSAVLSGVLANRDRDSPRESPREPMREPIREPLPGRPAVRRQPSDNRVRGPPPQPPTQKQMPLVSVRLSFQYSLSP